MIYTIAAVLVIIYVVMRLFPYFLNILGLTGSAFVSLVDKNEKNYEIRQRILASYSDFEDFEQNFPGFDQLSNRAKKEIWSLFKRQRKPNRESI